MNLIYLSADECLLKPYTEQDLPNFSSEFIRNDCLLRLEELNRDFDMVIVLTDHWAEHRISPDKDPYHRLHLTVRHAFNDRRIIDTSDNFIYRGKYAPIKDISDNPCVKHYVDPLKKETYLYCATQTHRKDPAMQDHCITITKQHGFSLSAFNRIYSIFSANKSSIEN